METTTLIAFIAAAALVAVVLFYLRGERGRAGATAADMARLAESAEKLSAAQSELAGRMQQAQSGMDQRLETLTKRLGDGLSAQTEKTGETLKGIHERLAVIDAAQKNITNLSEQVVGLQDILSNKQARGAFGEVRLQDLVQDCLPATAFDLQVTLSNRTKADCLIKLPNPPGSIVVDAKFPLEAYLALQEATDDGARKRASTALRSDVLKHVKDIAERYVIPGETAEWALLFLPSEAIYAELHANFLAVIDEAHRLRVAIVSPNTMWGVLNTIRALLRDVRLREQAHLIQGEVHKILEDIDRLNQRVTKLQRHFDQAGDDIREIRISSEKIVSRGERIEDMELEEESPVTELAPPDRAGDAG
ncbi:MAG: DNA recombination protein RmuC [Rhodospirillales bacterium]|jgi:DNA recombination protein RmuC|nr:DNA recombination protein RmuC [Rhodospirillales bacterium]